jgi:hypothetical protein
MGYYQRILVCKHTCGTVQEGSVWFSNEEILYDRVKEKFSVVLHYHNTAYNMINLLKTVCGECTKIKLLYSLNFGGLSILWFGQIFLWNCRGRVLHKLHPVNYRYMRNEMQWWWVQGYVIGQTLPCKMGAGMQVIPLVAQTSLFADIAADNITLDSRSSSNTRATYFQWSGISASFINCSSIQLHRLSESAASKICIQMIEVSGNYVHI